MMERRGSVYLSDLCDPIFWGPKGPTHLGEIAAPLIRDEPKMNSRSLAFPFVALRGIHFRSFITSRKSTKAMRPAMSRKPPVKSFSLNSSVRSLRRNRS